MRHLRIVAIVVILPVLVAACASVGTDAQMLSSKPETPKIWPKIYGAQVALGTCAFGAAPEAFIAALGAALLSSAIAEGVNRIGAALQSAAKTQTWQVKMSRNVEVSHATFGPCVQLVRGWFYLDPFDDKKKLDAAKAWFRGDFIDEGKFRILWQNRLWLAGAPDFVFEGRFESSTDRTALTVAPQYLRMDTPIGIRLLRPGKARSVAVFLAFHGPTEAGDAEKNPAASLIIGELEPGEPKVYPRALPLDASGVDRSPYEADWFTFKLGKDKEPKTVSAVVTETQGGNEFFAFVASVFGGAAKTITEEAQKMAAPEKARAEKETARTAKENAESAYDKKFVAAADALRKCEGGEKDLEQLAANARSAMRELNQTSRAVGKGNVFEEKQIGDIKMTGNAGEVKKACGAALATVS